MQCEGKLKLRSHNPGYLLIEVVNKADLARAAKRIFGPQGKRKLGPPPPILQIMILKLSPPRCVIRKEELVQQK